VHASRVARCRNILTIGLLSVNWPPVTHHSTRRPTTPPGLARCALLRPLPARTHTRTLTGFPVLTHSVSQPASQPASQSSRYCCSTISNSSKATPSTTNTRPPLPTPLLRPPSQGLGITHSKTQDTPGHPGFATRAQPVQRDPCRLLSVVRPAYQFAAAISWSLFVIYHCPCT
jgi:hypothetical protein